MGRPELCDNGRGGSLQAEGDRLRCTLYMSEALHFGGAELAHYISRLTSFVREVISEYGRHRIYAPSDWNNDEKHGYISSTRRMICLDFVDKT